MTRCVLRLFKTFNGFASGIGIRYAPSTLVRPAHQACAHKLIVGERMIPHTFVQAADVLPVNIHDHLPSDTRFKVLVFVGDIARPEVLARVRALAEEMGGPAHFVRRFGGQGDEYQQVFDFLCVCASKKEDVDWIGELAVEPRSWAVC